MKEGKTIIIINQTFPLKGLYEHQIHYAHYLSIMSDDILSIAIMDTNILTVALPCCHTTKGSGVEVKGKKDST